MVSETRSLGRQFNTRRDEEYDFAIMSTAGLPLFPLELVLYPGETIPLHIFEPRYKDMVTDCLDGDRSFGVVLVEDGELSRVGCVAEITEVLKRYSDGRFDIAVEGRRRFRLGDVDEERAYMRTAAEVLDERDEGIDRHTQQRLITQHMKLLELAGRDVSPSVYQGRDKISYFVAQNAGLSLRQKQEVLEIESEANRITFLVAFLESFIPQVERMDALRKKAQSNGHFRDFPPRLPPGEERREHES